MTARVVRIKRERRRRRRVQPATNREKAMLRAIGCVALVIFIIGLLVVTGVLKAIF